jgi:flagella basal body P-ring formation protein FlgA
VVEGRVRSWLRVAVALTVVLTCFRFATAASASTSCTVHLRPQASVNSSVLILSDIADLSGSDEVLVARLARISLGAVTDVRLLSRSEVLSLIRGAIPNLNDVQMTGAEFTRVSLATRVPDAAEIIAVLKAFMASVSPWQEEEIEIRSIDNLKAIEIPQGDVQLRIASRTAPSNYRGALLPMEAALDGRPVRSFWVKADVRVRARVVQVTKPVPYQGTLQAGDLREVVCDIEDPRSEYFRTCEEAIGMSAKRALGPGDLLNRNWLNEHNLVRSGETVRLLAQSGGISVTTLARALQNGKLGDRIKVRNLDSDRAVTAVVTGQGEVRVAQ